LKCKVSRLSQFHLVIDAHIVHESPPLCGLLYHSSLHQLAARRPLLAFCCHSCLRLHKALEVPFFPLFAQCSKQRPGRFKNAPITLSRA
jgi:hypothetical protein